MIGLLLLLIVLAAVVTLVERSFAPVDPWWTAAIRLVAALIVVWYLLGLIGYVPAPWPRSVLR